MMRHFRLHLPDGMTRHGALMSLIKALKAPLNDDDRRDAELDAEELRNEFTGLMQRELVGYEEAYHALRDLHRNTKPLKDRTKWIWRTHFNRYYRDQFVNGKRMAGHSGKLQQNEKEIIRRLANNEAEYAFNAMIDAETGEYTMPLNQRGTLYGNAVDEMLWLGFLYGDLSQGRLVKWVLSTAEHCIDCLWLAGRLDILENEIRDKIAARGDKGKPAEPTPVEQELLDIIDANRDTQGGRWGNGVYRAQELARMAIVPQSGRLVCTTNCKCMLEDAERPVKKPKQKEARERWESLLPKKPTMLKRTKRRKTRKRLAELADKWQHDHVARKDGEIL